MSLSHTVARPCCDGRVFGGCYDGSPSPIPNFRTPSKIALCLPIGGNLKNGVQRLERFLANPAVEATAWYRGVARAGLSCCTGCPLDLSLDATDLGERHPILFVAARYRGRAFPILWRMLPAEGCSAYTEQEALRQEVAALLPAGVQVSLYQVRRDTCRIPNLRRGSILQVSWRS
jgi:hypothetical protein